MRQQQREDYLVKSLDGSTRTLRYDDSVGPEFVRYVQSEVEGIESGREEVDVRLSDGRRVSGSCVPEPGCSLHLTLRIVGGKGGFGKAIKDLGRTFRGVSDKGDCRDARGRRVRTGEIELEAKRLKELAKEQERTKAEAAQLKQEARDVLRDAKEGCVDEEAVRREQKRVAKETASRVKDAVGKAVRGREGAGGGGGGGGGGGEVQADAGVQPAKKKAKRFLGDSSEEDSDDE